MEKFFRQSPLTPKIKTTKYFLAGRNVLSLYSGVVIAKKLSQLKIYPQNILPTKNSSSMVEQSWYLLFLLSFCIVCLHPYLVCVRINVPYM